MSLSTPSRTIWGCLQNSFCPTTWTEAVSDSETSGHWGTITRRSLMRSGAVKQPSDIYYTPKVCKAIVEAYNKDEVLVLHATPPSFVTAYYVPLRFVAFNPFYFNLLLPTRFLIRTVTAVANYFLSLKICPGILGNHGLSCLLCSSRPPRCLTSTPF